MGKFKKSKISNEKLYNWTIKMLNKIEKVNTFLLYYL